MAASVQEAGPHGFTETLYACSSATGNNSWLWLCVLFANFAEALAEGRGRARADTLRATKADTMGRLLDDPDEEPAGATQVDSASLLMGQYIHVLAGDIIPTDAEVVRGVASVDESAITGESAPVIREAGGDRSSVTGGTRIVSDSLVLRVTAEPGKSFLDRMIALVEGAERQRTPNEIALNILLAGLTLIFLFVVVTLEPFARSAGAAIAAEAGVDDYLAEATPEMKLDYIRREQAGGRLVAMCGDGSNDAPALAQADVGVAMNSGTPAAKEAANLIDLDSDPTKLIEVILVGKALLISRGSLTTFPSPTTWPSTSRSCRCCSSPPTRGCRSST